MKFIIKAALQQIFSRLPRSESLNYFFQRNVIRNFVYNNQVLLSKVDEANKHFCTFIHNYLDIKINDAHFFEFGAGWNLINPLTYYCFGIEQQTLIDIRQNIRLELINDIIAKFSELKSELEKMFNRQIRLPRKIKAISELFDIFGIRYLAPVDTCNTHFPSESFDFISNSATLEHIPENNISKVLKESYRILKPYGIMSCIIDLKDHYSYFDNSLSCYNFLKYSDKIYKLLNPSLHYQNRLRYPDYIKLFKQSGFVIVDQEVIGPNSADVEVLKNMRFADRFTDKYSLEELGIKSFWIALRKR